MKIKESSLLAKKHLELKLDGVEFYETSGIGGNRQFFRFTEIDAILRGPQLFAFQVGTETYSMTFHAGNKDHEAFADGLVAGVNRAWGRS